MGASRQCPDMVGGRMESAPAERVPPPRAHAWPRPQRSGSRAQRACGHRCAGTAAAGRAVSAGRFKGLRARCGGAAAASGSSPSRPFPRRPGGTGALESPGGGTGRRRRAHRLAA